MSMTEINTTEEFELEYYLNFQRCSYNWREWVSSFLTAHQHILRYLVPYSDVENTVKEISYNQGYLAMIKYK